MKRRYRTSEQWASETDWLGNQPLGAGAAGLIDTSLAQPDADADRGTSRYGRNANAATGSVLDQGGVIGNLMGHQL